MTKEQKEFLSKEMKRLKDYTGISQKGNATKDLPPLFALFNYMTSFAERYKKIIPQDRHPRELKCKYCDFETEKQNEKGLAKHVATRHKQESP